MSPHQVPAEFGIEVPFAIAGTSCFAITAYLASSSVKTEQISPCSFNTGKKALVSPGIAFSTGLTPRELRQAERTYSVVFSEDLAELLAYTLPSGPGWPDWRKRKDPAITAGLAWPVKRILFDIANNPFWPTEWGERPSSIESALEIARHSVEQAPRLNRIYGDRYLPARPTDPVFSVY